MNPFRMHLAPRASRPRSPRRRLVTVRGDAGRQPARPSGLLVYVVSADLRAVDIDFGAMPDLPDRCFLAIDPATGEPPGGSGQPSP